MMLESLVGMSMSVCVKHLLIGSVKISEVIAMVPGIRCRNQYEWNTMIDTYSCSYWKDFPMEQILKVTNAIAPLTWMPRVYGIDPIYKCGIEWVRFDKFTEYLAARRARINGELDNFPSQAYWM